MDDGFSGSFTNLSTTIGPSTFKYSINSGLTEGLHYRVKVIAVNNVGYVVGNIITTVAANVPDTPSTAPSFEKSETNAT